jgi:PTH1 family peptidyl-tRNA hydrolase
MENLHFIAGLGNPGGDYARTRHNAGFMVADLLAERWHATWKTENKFRSRVTRAEVQKRRAILCEPQTFMNLSGEAVKAVTDYYQIETGRILLVVDDADLPLGELRMRPKGGAGGHHGLESVSAHLGTTEYARLRVGIGRRQETERRLTGHVLGQFAKEETELLNKVLDRAACQVETWLVAGIEKAMNQFNGAVESSETKG